MNSNAMNYYVGGLEKKYKIVRTRKIKFLLEKLMLEKVI
jgi:hypothetical protein